MSKKRDDDESDDLWRYVTRDVKPLPRSAKRESPPLRGKKNSAQRQPARSTHTPPETDIQKMATDLDSRTDEKLRRGQMTIDGRVDLHGLGQDEAREVLNTFLLSGYHHGRRCVLVITGKGRDGKGVLRTLVPEWLREGALANIVLRFYPARPQHGGQGALYVLLRRQRD